MSPPFNSGIHVKWRAPKGFTQHVIDLMIEVHCVCCNGFFDVYKREHVSAAFIFTCLLTSYCHLVHCICHNIILYIYMIIINYIHEKKHRTTKEGWTWFLIHFDSRLLVSGGPSHLGQTTPLPRHCFLGTGTAGGGDWWSMKLSLSKKGLAIGAIYLEILEMEMASDQVFLMAVSWWISDS